jgi:putative ABC transport system ATP-binding protein
VLADEPTANLDSATSAALLDIMERLNAELGTTFIFSTHDPRVVAHAVRVVTLVDGRVASDEQKPEEAPHEILPAIGKSAAPLGA